MLFCLQLTKSNKIKGFFCAIYINKAVIYVVAIKSKLMYNNFILF